MRISSKFICILTCFIWLTYSNFDELSLFCEITDGVKLLKFLEWEGLELLFLFFIWCAFRLVLKPSRAELGRNLVLLWRLKRPWTGFKALEVLPLDDLSYKPFVRLLRLPFSFNEVEITHVAVVCSQGSLALSFGVSARLHTEEKLGIVSDLLNLDPLQY